MECFEDLMNNVKCFRSLNAGHLINAIDHHHDFSSDPEVPHNCLISRPSLHSDLRHLALSSL